MPTFLKFWEKFLVYLIFVAICWKKSKKIVKKYLKFGECYANIWETLKFQEEKNNAE